MSSQPQADPAAELSLPRRTVGAGAAVVLAGQVSALSLGMLLGIVIARLLGPAGTGTFNLVGSSALILSSLGSLGVGAGALYWVSRGAWPASDAIRQVQLAALALGSLAALIGVALVLGPAAKAFEGISIPLVVLGLSAAPFVLSWMFSGQIAIAMDRQEAWAVAVAANVGLTLLFVVALAPWAGVGGAIAAATIAPLCVAVGLLGIWARRALPAPSPDWLPATSRRLREAASYGLRAYVPSALQIVNNRIDLVVLSAFATQASVGHYAIALNLALVATQVPSSLVQVVTARVAALDHSEGRWAQRLVVVKMMRHSALLTIAVCVVMALALPLIPIVYGGGFSASIEPGYVLIGATASAGIGNATGALLLGKGRADLAMRRVIVITAIAVPAYALLIPELGVIGAAIGSAASQLAGAFAGLFYFRRVFTEVSPGELLPRWEDLRDYRDFVRRGVSARRGRGSSV